MGIGKRPRENAEPQGPAPVGHEIPGSRFPRDRESPPRGWEVDAPRGGRDMRRSSSSLIPILIITLVGGLAFFDEAPRIAPGGAAPVVAAAPLERAPAALDSVAGARASRGAPGGLPLRFEANRGQTDASVRFVARGAGTVLLPADEAVRGAGRSGSDNEPSRRVAVSMRLVGADPRRRCAGEQPLAGRTNYLRGQDRPPVDHRRADLRRRALPRGLSRDRSQLPRLRGAARVRLHRGSGCGSRAASASPSTASSGCRARRRR